MTGFIKLHRQITKWEWYQDTNVFRVFMHILIKANFEDKKWQGIDVKRGDLITSYSHLALETGLSNQQTRTAIDKLKSTGEITIKTTNKYSQISVTYYNKYQDINKQPNKRITNKQQTNNKQDNSQVTTTKEREENKNDKNVKKVRWRQPTLSEVKSYCLERSNGVDPERFVDYYSSNGWKVGKNPMKDWKASVRTWEKTSPKKEVKLTWREKLALEQKENKK